MKKEQSNESLRGESHTLNKLISNKVEKGKQTSREGAAFQC